MYARRVLPRIKARKNNCATRIQKHYRRMYAYRAYQFARKYKLNPNVMKTLTVRIQASARRFLAIQKVT
jgi:hypothetical protein